MTEMEHQPGAAQGPDLREGVPVDDVREGLPFLGHAGGEPVVLARSGEGFFAVAATCTHYGGPLAEGLVSDGMLRCPWHHACFVLRTGEAVRAPAFAPVACYRVEVSGGRVRVAERQPEASPKATAPSGPSSVVIVGAGAAACAAAHALRREGYGGAVTLIGAEETGPVDRPNLSKEFLSGKAPEEWIPLAMPEGVDLRTGARVTEVDTKGRHVRLADGSRLPWGALLLATGADVVQLDVPGSDLPHVHTLRTLADSKAIIEGAGRAKRAVVVGAGFIGLEVAAALRERGVGVDVVAPVSSLGKILGPEVGAFLERLHQEHGVVLHIGEGVASISQDAVALASGATLPADLVVVGIGVRPATALAERAGLRVERGIVVDERLETSVPGVFAAGDVARWPDPRFGGAIRVEHWVVAERMGAAAARSILGRPGAFRDVPFFWSAHYDVVFAYVGHAERWDRIDMHGSLAAHDATLAYREGDRTRAVVTIGRDRTSLEAERAFEQDDHAALDTFGRTR
jgi:NADPH-dependent 2,4-dienoyl-CoA reductase/sulfur reductase-like enzyme/nitrite reductase/ring-hydroxylating ferredoxin subunit